MLLSGLFLGYIVHNISDTSDIGHNYLLLNNNTDQQPSHAILGYATQIAIYSFGTNVWLATWVRNFTLKYTGQYQTSHILGMAICTFDLIFCKDLYQSVSDNSFTNLPRIP